MTRVVPSRPWKRLGAVPFDRLAEARIQLHVAAGMAGSVGEALAAPEADYGHVSLVWHPETETLLGAPTRPGPPVRSGVRPGTLELVVLGDGVGREARLPLAGRAVEEAWAWLEATLADFVPSARGVSLRRRDIRLPAAGQGEERFGPADTDALRELSAWLADADALLAGLRARSPGASPVRCWPHHLDIATLVVLDREAPPEEARSIGAGLSAGDGSFPEPYWYVSAWPTPPDSRVEDLAGLAGGGRWHTEGWFGAVLPGPELVSSSEAGEQAARAGAFLASAVRACRSALGES